jgi:hypothetical protein
VLCPGWRASRTDPYRDKQCCLYGLQRQYDLGGANDKGRALRDCSCISADQPGQQNDFLFGVGESFLYHFWSAETRTTTAHTQRSLGHSSPPPPNID